MLTEYKFSYLVIVSTRLTLNVYKFHKFTESRIWENKKSNTRRRHIASLNRMVFSRQDILKMNKNCKNEMKRGVVIKI